MKPEPPSSTAARIWSARVALARGDAPAARDPGPLLRAARVAASGPAPASFGADFAALFGARPVLAGFVALAAATFSFALGHASSEWSAFSAWIDLAALSGGLFS